MELSRPPLVVAFELSEKRKAIVADALAGASAVVYLTELDEAPGPAPSLGVRGRPESSRPWIATLGSDGRLPWLVMASPPP
jgi:hypothetical protein